MKAVVMAILVSLPFASAADEVDGLKESVRNGTTPLDHIARIGDFDYEIFVDRTVTPALAMARITEESMDLLFAVSDREIGAKMSNQQHLVQDYLSQITGRSLSIMKQGSSGSKKKGNI